MKEQVFWTAYLFRKYASMLKGISWTQFIESIAIVLAGYYLVIGVVYYRQPLMGLLQGKWPFGRNALRLKVTVSEEDMKKELIPLLRAVHDLMQEIMVFVNKGLVKEELLYVLAGSISNYPELKGTNLQGLVTQFVAVECAEKCSIHLGEQELSGLWKGEVGHFYVAPPAGAAVHIGNE